MFGTREGAAKPLFGWRGRRRGEMGRGERRGVSSCPPNWILPYMNR